MRIFAEKSAFSGNCLRLNEGSDRHLRQVLRIKPGDRLEVVVDSALLRVVRVESIRPGAIEFSLVSESALVAARLPMITLAQCLPKQDKMAEILRACAEIGVSRFIPVISERTEAKGIKRERWEKVLESAAEQSKQSAVPILESEVKLSALKFDADLILLPWEEERQTTLKSVLQKAKTPKSILVIIGPEGGLAAREVELLKKIGAIPMSLGPTVLRVEHAAFFACAQIFYALTDPG